MGRQLAARFDRRVPFARAPLFWCPRVLRYRQYAPCPALVLRYRQEPFMPRPSAPHAATHIGAVSPPQFRGSALLKTDENVFSIPVFTSAPSAAIGTPGAAERRGALNVCGAANAAAHLEARDASCSETLARHPLIPSFVISTPVCTPCLIACSTLRFASQKVAVALSTNIVRFWIDACPQIGPLMNLSRPVRGLPYAPHALHQRLLSMRQELTNAPVKS